MTYYVSHAFKSAEDAEAFVELVRGTGARHVSTRHVYDNCKPINKTRLGILSLENMTPGRSYTISMITDLFVDNGYSAKSAASTLSALCVAGFVEKIDTGLYQRVEKKDG